MNIDRGKTGKRLDLPPFLKKLTSVQIGMILGLLLFETFNFDTSRFALKSILGDQQFVGLSWASILAVAFCAIDSLSLIQLFGLEEEGDLKDWLLMGVWLIGATLNASLTWWSVSIIMLTQNIGNEVLSREEILFYAPIIIAVLVFLTRVTLIGTLAFAESPTAGERKKEGRSNRSRSQSSGDNRPRPQPIRATQATLSGFDDLDGLDESEYAPSQNGHRGY